MSFNPMELGKTAKRHISKTVKKLSKEHNLNAEQVSSLNKYLESKTVGEKITTKDRTRESIEGFGNEWLENLKTSEPQKVNNPLGNRGISTTDPKIIQQKSQEAIDAANAASFSGKVTSTKAINPEEMYAEISGADYTPRSGAQVAEEQAAKRRGAAQTRDFSDEQVQAMNNDEFYFSPDQKEQLKKAAKATQSGGSFDTYKSYLEKHKDSVSHVAHHNRIKQKADNFQAEYDTMVENGADEKAKIALARKYGINTKPGENIQEAANAHFGKKLEADPSLWDKAVGHNVPQKATALGLTGGAVLAMANSRGQKSNAELYGV